MLVIIDYGMGNLKSVANACAVLGCESMTTADPNDLSKADRIILPGVGAFAQGMANLREAGWVEALYEHVKRQGKPFLGICLGTQLIATQSTEQGLHQGLDWVKGNVERLPVDEGGLRVPHMGWNEVHFDKTDGLYAGLGESRDYYFVHSYVLVPEDEGVTCGRCNYGIDFAASVSMDNIYATQYHPEKSQRAGLAVLQNFLNA